MKGNAELIAMLRRRYSVPVIPPCRICETPRVFAWWTVQPKQAMYCCPNDSCEGSDEYLEVMLGDSDVVVAMDRMADCEAKALRYRKALEKIALEHIRPSGKPDGGRLQCAGLCGAIGPSTTDPWRIVHELWCDLAILNPDSDESIEHECID